MIKKLRLINFEAHEDSKLDFVEGVNVIAGPSDNGKSSIIRALSLIILNRPAGEAYRRHGADPGSATAVVATFDDCRVRRLRSNSDNIYAVDGEIFKAMRADVPEEVKTATRMDDLNIQTQFSSQQHFLLSMSGGEVARYLNSVVSLDIIDTTLKKVNSIAVRAAATAKEEKARAFALAEELESLSWLDSALELGETARGLEESCAKFDRKTERLQEALDDYLSITAAMKKGKAVLNKMSAILDMCAEEYKKSEEELIAIGSVETALKSYHLAAEAAADSKKALDTAKKAMAEAESAVKLCPTCKRPL